jgi:5-methylcytosine-specific restriction endonuclease McrA
MAAKHRRLALAIVSTDSSFVKVDLRGRPGWQGKCIHCNSKVLVAQDGQALGQATIEHIVPRNHGGTDELENVALACARCNQGKGSRLDWRSPDDPTLRRVIATLRERRQRRWREPDPSSAR